MRPVAEPQKDKRALLVEPDAGFGRHEKNRLNDVKENMALIPGARESFEERQQRLTGQRVKYAPMIAHQEMAAIALASGSTMKQAAAKAGISTRQVRKYYTEADFRARIEELRQTVFSKIRGRVLKELENRTDPNRIGQVDLLDLLRIHDRVYGAPGGKGAAGIQIGGDLNVGTSQYDTIIAALLAPESGGQGADFPIYEPTDVSPSSDSPPE